MDDLRIKNQWPLMKTVIVWFLLAVILFGGLAWAGLIAKPSWLSLERKAFTASHQYIETKRTAISTMISQCSALPEGIQKQELRQRITAEKALIPSDAQPHGGC